jgi:transaldolase
MRHCSIEIAKLIAPRPLSIEVTTDDHEGMLLEARDYAGCADNVNVKITITTRAGESCLPIVHELSCDGIDVNVTAMMTFNQAMLAAKAGAKYVSLFGGRVDDEGGDAERAIRSVREWLDRWSDSCPNFPEIIVGSSRTTRNVADWAQTGAHILTVTPIVLSKMLVNARTKETVSQFLDDAASALKSMK